MVLEEGEMGKNPIIKGYQVERKIDEQGLRSLFTAQQIRSGKQVFITTIPTRAESPALEFLKRRSVMSQKLLHPALVTAIDFGTTNNDYFYYAHNATPSFLLTQVLDEINDSHERLFSMIRWFIQALEIIAYLHEANITHRDLATNHLRINNQGNLIIEGFINARPKIEANNIINTVHLPYMSPEQLLGAASDKKTDIYSLGVILFELVTGQLPYTSNYHKVGNAKEGIPPQPSMYKLDVPPEIESMILRAMASRTSRYNNTHEWLLELEEFYSKRSMRMKLQDIKLKLKNILSIGS